MVLGMGGCPSQEQIARDFEAKRAQSYRQLVENVTPDPNSDLRVLRGALRLDDCLVLAFKHNKDVQAARVGLLEAKGRMTEAVSTAMPTATLGGFAIASDDKISFGPRETYDVGVTVRQPLYLGGLAGAALDAASVYTYMVAQQVRQATQAVEVLIRQDFLEALLAAELAEVAVQAKADAEEHLADVEKKLRFGAGTRFEVLRAEVRVSALDAELIRANNKAKLAITNLLNDMGVSQMSQVELVGVLAYEPVRVGQAAGLVVALSKRADLLIGEAMIRLAENNVKAEQAGDRPKVYLQGEYRRGYPGVAFGFGGREWQRSMNAGFVLEWPLFDGLLTTGKVTQAKAEVQRQQVGQRKLELQVQFEVTQALVNLEDAEKFVISQQGNVDNGVESLRLARVSFREGAGTSLDVISVELALAEARSDFITAVQAYELAEVGLHAALGTIGEQPLPEMVTDPNAASNAESEVPVR